MNELSFDLVIIGGGATGAGIALDATLRGFKCLLVEKNDFAEGTSSRSTKLVHGGVRYLEAAVKKLDINQFNLVKEGLKERYRLLHNAPFLAHPITLVTPLYHWYEIPYMYVGLALYDLISGKKRLGKSTIVGKKEIIGIFPSVKKSGLKGGVRYFDGAFNDARMALALIQSAKELGCEVRNQNEVMSFIYKENYISGAKIKNKIKNKTYNVTSKFVINATGVFCDALRKMDDENTHDIIEASSGIHIVLDKKFLPNGEGLMIPKTEDGRVLFMLPWMGKCLIGTTDEQARPQEHPKVKNEDIEYLLRHTQQYFDVEIQKSDILSSWAGLRPLITLKHTTDTKGLVREHYIEKSKSNLISIAGGKWTSYRKMAEELVDFIQELDTEGQTVACSTKKYKLFGNRENMQKINEEMDNFELEGSIKKHLIKTYGSMSIKVAQYIQQYGSKKIHKNYDITEAEVYYGIEFEFVNNPLDFIIRRVGLGLIDLKAAKSCVPAVSVILKEYYKWSDKIYDKKVQEANIILEKAI